MKLVIRMHVRNAVTMKENLYIDESLVVVNDYSLLCFFNDK